MSLEAIERQAIRIAHTILLEADLLKSALRRDRILRLEPIVIEQKAAIIAQKIEQESRVLLSEWKLARKLADNPQLSHSFSKLVWKQDRESPLGYSTAEICDGLIGLCVMRIEGHKWIWQISGGNHRFIHPSHNVHYVLENEAKLACFEKAQDLLSEWT